MPNRTRERPDLGRCLLVGCCTRDCKKSEIGESDGKIIEEPLPLVYETIAARYPRKEREARTELARQMYRLARITFMPDSWPLGGRRY